MARFRLGKIPVAIEVSAIQSLLDSSELQDSHIVVDLGDRWDLEAHPKASQFAHIQRSDVVVSLGDGVDFEHWSSGRIAFLPRWIAAHLPPEIKPVCGLGEDGDIVFIVDAEAISELKP